MTAKEKAKELVDKYFYYLVTSVSDNFYINEDHAKQCALIAVDETIQAIRFTEAKDDLGYVGFWQEVKQEIENL